WAGASSPKWLASVANSLPCAPRHPQARPSHKDYRLPLPNVVALRALVCCRIPHSHLVIAACTKLRIAKTGGSFTCPGVGLAEMPARFENPVRQTGNGAEPGGRRARSSTATVRQAG